MLWIRQAGPHLWTEQGAMDECGLLGPGEQFWTDVLGVFSGFGKILDSEDGLLYAASRRTLISLFVKTGKDPVLHDSLRLDKKIDAMRVFEGRLYVNYQNGATVTVNASVPGSLAVEGPHEVSWWVKGQEIEQDLVYLLDRNVVRIGRVEPQGGWPW